MPATKRKITEPELSGMLSKEIDAAVGYIGSELSDQRRKAMEYYLGEPFGNEVEGRSKVVSTDVADTIEWILPALLDIFTSGDDVVRFDPQGPEDEQVADAATDYVNWIFNRDNPGFLVLYMMFKDGLLQKNGIGKVWWEEKEDEDIHKVEDADDATYGIAASDPDIELIEHTVHSEAAEEASESSAPVPPAFTTPMGAPGAGGSLPAMGDLPAARLHTYTYRKKPEGRVKVCAVPPEEFLINRKARTLEEARYVGHRVRKTQSELIAEGYDPEVIKNLPADDDAQWDMEEQARDRIIDTDVDMDLSQGATREIWVVESYMKVDWDGDGIAERRKITSAGAGAIILENEEWSGPVPFVSLTPVIMPHRFYGLSIADLVMDLQLIKSTVLRQILDNLYLSNNGRHVISDQVNLDDFLVSRPGGVVRLLNGAVPGAGHVMPLETPLVAAQAFPMLEYLDGVRENRTGVTRYNQGIDANSLNKTATGINQIMTAAQQRIKLIARIFAETGVKDLFRLILKCVTTYQNKPRMIRLNNEWVAIDPRQWESEYDVTINVGLGTGNRDTMLGHLMNITQMQAQAMMAGAPIVTWENIYNTQAQIVKNAGLKGVEAFWTDPKTAQPKPPPPDPKMLEVQQKGQAEQAKLQLQAQTDAAKLQMQAQNDQAKLQLEIQKVQAEIELEKLKAGMDAQLQLRKADMDANVKRETAAMASKPQVSLSLDKDASNGISGDINSAFTAQTQMLQQFMMQQAERDSRQNDQIAALALAIAAPRQKTITGKLPSGNQFNATVTDSGNT